MCNIHQFHPITLEEKIKVKKNKDLSDDDVTALSSFLRCMLHYRSRDRKDAGAAAMNPWLWRGLEGSSINHSAEAYVRSSMRALMNDIACRGRAIIPPSRKNILRRKECRNHFPCTIAPSNHSSPWSSRCAFPAAIWCYCACR